MMVFTVRILLLCVLIFTLQAFLFLESQNNSQNHRVLDGPSSPITGVNYYTQYYYADSMCSQLYFSQSVVINQCYYSTNVPTNKVVNDYVMNTVLSIGNNKGYLLTQSYYVDTQCVVPDTGSPASVNSITPSQCQAVNSGMSSFYGNMFVIARISSSPPSTWGGITINGYGQSDCSGNPQEISYYSGNAAGTLNSGMSTCLGIYQGVCGMNSIGLQLFPPTYPVTSAKCTTGTSLGKYSYPITCTAKGYIGQGIAYYGKASCIDPPSTNAAAPACFADTEMVQLEVLHDSVSSNKYIALKEVKIGDRILTINHQGQQVFSPVVYLPHHQNTERTMFVVLTTESGRDVKMTKSHYLPAGICSSPFALPIILANQVRVGDCVHTISGREQIVSVDTVEGKGIYTIIAMEELIVVNGIIATPYGGINPTIANVYYNLHRLVYAIWTQQSMISLTVQIQSFTEIVWSILSTLSI